MDRSCDYCGDYIEDGDEFHRCPECNAVVCCMCYLEDEGVCTDCAETSENILHCDPEDLVFDAALQLKYGASGVSGVTGGE